MGKRSVKEDKNIYQLSREEAGMTRAQASEALGFISESRIEKIESERSEVRPDEVLAMARVYKKPSLCNYYCSKECPIGQEYVPQVEIKSLPQVVLELLSSLNSLEKHRERFIDIAANGEISDDELSDFIRIQDELSRISISIDSLNLWLDDTIASGKIDEERIRSIKDAMNK